MSQIIRSLSHVYWIMFCLILTKMVCCGFMLLLLRNGLYLSSFACWIADILSFVVVLNGFYGSSESNNKFCVYVYHQILYYQSHVLPNNRITKKWTLPFFKNVRFAPQEKFVCPKVGWFLEMHSVNPMWIRFKNK